MKKKGSKWKHRWSQSIR